MTRNYCTPLTLKFKDNVLKVIYSIDDATALDINGCEYADLVSFESIINAEPTVYGNINVIRNSTYMEKCRLYIKDENLGVLLLNIASKIILIIDDRELLIEMIK